MFEINNYIVNRNKNRKKFIGLRNIFTFLNKLLSFFLILVFFIIIIFVGIIFKIFRKDFLNKKIDENYDSYWENRKNKIGSMNKQF